MYRFPILFFLFLSAACLNFSCGPYRHMQKIESEESCVLKLKPDFSRVIYKTSVNVIGNHISGLLLIKYMQDSSTRIVFSNEMGFTFFDFGFETSNRFIVHQVIPQMNKKGLIKMLRKDFELLLFRNMDSTKAYSLAAGNLIYHAFPQSEGINYYITDLPCHQLIKMQIASDKKPRMEALIYNNAPDNPPDSILIRHLNFFHLTISLKKIIPLAPE